MNMAPGPGRPKGGSNKATIEIKEAFRNLIELNTPNMIEWMQRIAEEDPGKALALCASLAEFVIPKLARQEIKGDHQFTLVVNTGVNAPLPVKQELEVIEHTETISGVFEEKLVEEI